MTKMSEREFEAFQSYVLATKLFWTSDMFAELKRVYERKLAQLIKESKFEKKEVQATSEDFTKSFNRL